MTLKLQYLVRTTVYFIKRCILLFIYRVLMKSTSPAFHQPLKYKERGVVHSKRSTDDRADQTSVKSTDSISYPSPCASPSPPSSGKVYSTLKS